MEIAFFSGTTLSLILFLWQFTYCLSGYNKTFAGITATMLQNAVIVSMDEDVSLIVKPEKPYFGEAIVQAIVGKYVNSTMPSAVIGGNYGLSFSFSEHQYSRNRFNEYYPMMVTITLNYSSPIYSASREKSFRITEGAAYES